MKSSFDSHKENAYYCRTTFDIWEFFNSISYISREKNLDLPEILDHKLFRHIEDPQIYAASNNTMNIVNYPGSADKARSLMIGYLFRDEEISFTIASYANGANKGKEFGEEVSKWIKRIAEVLEEENPNQIKE